MEEIYGWNSGQEVRGSRETTRVHAMDGTRGNKKDTADADTLMSSFVFRSSIKIPLGQLRLPLDSTPWSQKRSLLSPRSSLHRFVALNNDSQPVNKNPHFFINPSDTSHPSSAHGSPQIIIPRSSTSSNPSYNPPTRSSQRSSSSNWPWHRIKLSRSCGCGTMSIQRGYGTVCCSNVGAKFGGRSLVEYGRAGTRRARSQSSESSCCSERIITLVCIPRRALYCTSVMSLWSGERGK